MSIRQATQEEIDQLIQIGKRVGLDPQWLSGVVALTMQEIIIKKKLEDFGIQIGDEEFQKYAAKLEAEYKARGEAPPSILLSIIRAYRHIRAQLVHEGHHSKIGEGEAKALVTNTLALLDILYPLPSVGLIPDKLQQLKAMDDNDLKRYTEEAELDEIEAVISLLMAEFKELPSWCSSDDIRYLERILSFTVYRNDKEFRIKLAENILSTLLGSDILTNSQSIQDRKIQDSLISNLVKLLELKYIQDWIFRKGYIDSLIDIYGGSWSFDSAAMRTKIAISLAPYMNNDQLNRVIDIALSHEQIHFCFKAQDLLTNFIKQYYEKLNNTKAEELLELLERSAS